MGKRSAGRHRQTQDNSLHMLVQHCDLESMVEHHMGSYGQRPRVNEPSPEAEDTTVPDHLSQLSSIRMLTDVGGVSR